MTTQFRFTPPESWLDRSTFAFLAAMCQGVELVQKHPDVTPQWFVSETYHNTFKAMRGITEAGEIVTGELVSAFLVWHGMRFDADELAELFEVPVSGTCMEFHKRNLRHAWFQNEKLRIGAHVEREFQHNNFDVVAALAMECKQLLTGHMEQ
ncbi:MAG: hypothetical protein ABGZ53_14595 [Fuerstiella sp.]